MVPYRPNPDLEVPGVCIPDKNGVHPKIKRPHRATGNPRGRPRVHPTNFDEQILASLRRRMNVTTRVVVPYWRGLVEEFHIGRNTLAKAIKSLKEKGLIEKVYDQSVTGTDNSGSIYLVHPVTP